MPIEAEEFERWMNVLKDDIHGVHTRLDALNGRTRDSEKKIAVLEDRSEQACDPAARWGAGIAVFGGILAELAHRLWGAK